MDRWTGPVVVQVIGIVNSSINPFVYMIFNGMYRKELVSLLCADTMQVRNTV